MTALALEIMNLSSQRLSERMDSQPYHMRPWDEVLGPALGVKEHDGHCLALIGKIPVVLPLEMAARLTEAKGQRIGVLRTDCDYRFRLIQEGIKDAGL